VDLAEIAPELLARPALPAVTHDDELQHGAAPCPPAPLAVSSRA
jgi:hypothetical protein